MDVKWKKRLLLAGLAALTAVVRVMSARGAFYTGPVPFDLFPIVAMMSLVAGCSSRSPAAALVPVVAMTASDAVLYASGSAVYMGATSLWLSAFVLSGFAAISLLGWKLAGRSPGVVWFAGGSVWSVLLYDTWTNFGFYLAFYPPTLASLVECYLSAVPFTVMHLLGMVVLAVPGYVLVRALTPDTDDTPEATSRPVST